MRSSKPAGVSKVFTRTLCVGGTYYMIPVKPKVANLLLSAGRGKECFRETKPRRHCLSGS